MIVVRTDKYNIEGLQVEVEDPLAMDELDTADYLADEYLALSLGETVVIWRSSCDEVSARQILSHQHRVEWGLEQAHQLHHKGRLYEGMEHIFLCPHLPLLLLLVLGCCKHACPEVLHQEHMAKGAGADLPDDLVPLLEVVPLPRLP